MTESLRPAGAPKSGGSTLYIAGTVAFALLTAGVLWARFRSSSTEAAAPAPVASVKPPQPRVNLDAPPPPPPPEEPNPSAGTEAGAAGRATGSGVAAGTAAVAAPSVCVQCGAGQSNPTLNAQITSAGQSARGCYNRALRNGEVSGSLTVSLQVGQGGTVCGASVVNDSVHSSEVSSCVLSQFRGRTYASPTQGCVTVNVPISFSVAGK